MRYYHRLLTLAALIVSSRVYALGFFIEGLEWRATESNDWAYVNSLTVPYQTLDYKTIDFSYTPGFRLGLTYVNDWDGLLSYTRFYTTTNDSVVGNIQPSFLGSVTAKPLGFYLYQSGEVRQIIDYNMFDLNIGKAFELTQSVMLHPLVGFMGGWINQSIFAQYNGTLTTNEKLINNFSGVGPKVGVDTRILLFNYKEIKPYLTASFATSYLLGNWQITDETTAIPTFYYFINGASRSMGAFAIQGSMGLNVDYHQMAVKLAYEMGDWFDQNQFFDNDTGAHNNDLILQGLTLGVSYQFT